MSAKIRFSKSAILFRIKCGPVKLLELAQGSKNYSVRKRLMRHINALEADGAIKKLWMQGFPHYVTADYESTDYESTDDDQVRALLGNCRPVDGCMVWAGHIDLLAERYDVSSSLIGQVKRHEVWVEHDTYCAGLFKEAA